jgi:hypothetical protein
MTSQYGEKYDAAQVVLAAAEKKVKAAEASLLAAKQEHAKAFFAAQAIRLGIEDARRKAAEDEATAKRLRAIEKAKAAAKKQQDARVKEFINS